MKENINLEKNFYKSFKKINHTFSKETFECAEKTVSDLLHIATTSEHPGMLLGKVQSGKTRTFISVIALAFDNQFDIVIVLSKNSKALIQQTYKRLRKDFEIFLDDNELEIYDIMSSPKKFTNFELDSKLIFIAKKQSDNLKHLIELFENNPKMSEKKVLIIDDEADNASIGYSKEKEIINAKTIAGKISDLRSRITNVSFLQVTATPYSLYLQPTEIEVDNIVDFKPMRPAFTNLVPVPKEYVGGDTYFGERSRSGIDTVESLIHYAVDHDEFGKLKKLDGRSVNINKLLEIKQIQGYRTALITFIVGGCIQRINGIKKGENPKKLLYSFLLHSESTKFSHSWQENLTNELFEQLKNSIIKQPDLFRDLIQISYDDLSKSLELNNEIVPTLEDVIFEVTVALNDEYITISKVNSEENVINLLDDTGQLKLRSPLNIFIGGQVLDRGITLANLIGFYYGRRPNKFQQDTVLQHSRMFGYRRKNLAVTRFYTSRAIRLAMQKMEEFDASLREAIEAGNDKSVQFIRKAEDGTIIPCNPNKILVSTIHTLKKFKRILPIGFQSGYNSGKNGISKNIDKLDILIQEIIEFNSGEPVLISVDKAYELLELIKPTLRFEEPDETPAFDWDVAFSAMAHLSAQHPDKEQRGKILLWAAQDRNSARLSGEGSHSTYIETPDSPKTEGKIASKHAINTPILFLLRQNGNIEKGWRGAPFYWPVIRAQANTPTAIFAMDIIN